jgi:hypothetical protein
MQVASKQLFSKENPMGKNKKESRKRFQPGPHGGYEALLYEFREPPLLSDDEDDLPPASGQVYPRTVLIAAKTFDEALHIYVSMRRRLTFTRSGFSGLSSWSGSPAN